MLHERFHWVLIVIAGFLADGAVALHLTPTLDRWSAVMCGLALGQITVLAIRWPITSRSPLLPLLASLAVAGGLSWPLSHMAGGAIEEWFLMLLLLSIITGLVIPVGRVVREVRVAHTGSPSAGRGGSRRSSDHVRCLRWSLAGLFSTVTCIAVLLVIPRYTAFPWHHARGLVLYGISAVAVAVATHCSYSNGPSAGRLVAWAVVWQMGAAVMRLAEYSQSHGYFAFVLLIEAMTIWIALAVLGPSNTGILSTAPRELACGEDSAC